MNLFIETLFVGNNIKPNHFKNSLKSEQINYLVF